MGRPLRTDHSLKGSACIAEPACASPRKNSDLHRAASVDTSPLLTPLQGNERSRRRISRLINHGMRMLNVNQHVDRTHELQKHCAQRLDAGVRRASDARSGQDFRHACRYRTDWRKLLESCNLAVTNILRHVQQPKKQVVNCILSRQRSAELSPSQLRECSLPCQIIHESKIVRVKPGEECIHPTCARSHRKHARIVICEEYPFAELLLNALESVLPSGNPTSFGNSDPLRSLTTRCSINSWIAVHASGRNPQTAQNE